MVIHAAGRYGARALGVTLSEQQHELAQRRISEAGLEDRAEVRLMDYRDVRTEGSDGEGAYDKIASVGMFEHVGRERLPDYFTHVYRLLKPNGLFLNQGIAGKPVQRSWWGSVLHRFLNPLPCRWHHLPQALHLPLRRTRPLERG